MPDVTYRVDVRLDCQGLSCPLPILRTKQTMDGLHIGQVLEVTATDPGSLADIRSWAHRTGHQYLGTIRSDHRLLHYVRKLNPGQSPGLLQFSPVAQNEDLRKALPVHPHILDVREPMEFAFGHIPGARLMPLGQIASHWQDIADWSSALVYVICRTGHRSDLACHLLAERGFQQVHNVLPGMTVWDGPVDRDLPSPPIP